MPICYIKDLEDIALRPYKSLALLREKHDQSSCFIAETHTVIQNAINAGCIPHSFLVAEKYIAGRDKVILQRFPDVTVYTASDEILEQLTGFPLTRGILSVMTRPTAYTMESIIKHASRIAVLVNVQDASNIGAIMRSACGLGIDAVVLDASCCDPLHRKAIRTSMGAVFKLPWVHSDQSGSALALALHASGFRTLAFALTSNAISLQKESFKVNEPLALFFGSEGNGLDKSTIENCTEAVLIPMANEMDSLNVAAAAAIVFWEVARNSIC